MLSSQSLPSRILQTMVSEQPFQCGQDQRIGLKLSNDRQAGAHTDFRFKSHGKSWMSNKERRRVQTSAIFYSECTLQGISMDDADAAALDAKEWLEKWRERTHRVESGTKRRRHERKEPYKEEGLFSIAECEPSHLGPLQIDSCTDRLGNQGHELHLKMVLGEVARAKEDIVAELKGNGGNTTGSVKFNDCLSLLENFYASTSTKPSLHERLDIFEGSWLALSKPTFSDCQGKNDVGEYMYSLGRMSFDMFRPTRLRCSVQGIYNRIVTCSSVDSGHRPKTVPLGLQKVVSSQNVPIRAYDIVVAFSVDQGDGEKPINGLLTNCGYCIPDPTDKHRLTVWFSGGILEKREGTSCEEWGRLFAEETLPKRDLGELARVIAARILLGAKLPESIDDQGVTSYSLSRPIGGHGSVYVDTIFSDHSLRIVKGHMGSTFVFHRAEIPK